MAITLPTSIGSGSNVVSSTTVSMTLTAAVAAGQRITAFGGCDNNAAPPGPTGAFSDSKGNTWRTDVSATTLENASCYIGTCDVTNALAVGDTVTFTVGVAKFDKLIAAVQMSGVAIGAASLDKTTTTTEAVTTWGGVTLTVVGEEIVFGACCNNDQVAARTSIPGSGMTELFDFTNTDFVMLTVVYQYMPSGGNSAPSGTWSAASTGGWNMAGATYKASGPPAVQPQIPGYTRMRTYAR